MPRFLPRLLPLLLCLSLPALAADKTAPSAEALESVMTMQVDSHVKLDEKGALVAFKVETQVPDALRLKLERMVGAWHFTPTPAPDGVARAISSPMRLTLAATKVGEGYRVKVDHVIFPAEAPAAHTGAGKGAATDGITAVKIQPPRFPPGLDRGGVNGVVLVTLLLDADGKVMNAVAVQSKLINVTGREGTMARALKQFEDYSLAVARDWRFNVPPALAQAGAEGRTVNVPVSFNGNPKSKHDLSVSVPEPGTWRIEVRTPRREIEWLQASPGRQRIGVSDLANGEVMPAVGLVKLDTDVVGMDVM